jgi:hypothetical protein
MKGRKDPDAPDPPKNEHENFCFQKLVEIADHPANRVDNAWRQRAKCPSHNQSSLAGIDGSHSNDSLDPGMEGAG